MLYKKILSLTDFRFDLCMPLDSPLWNLSKDFRRFAAPAQRDRIFWGLSRPGEKEDRGGRLGDHRGSLTYLSHSFRIRRVLIMALPLIP